MFFRKSRTQKRGVALALNSSYFGFFAHGGFLYELNRLGVYPAAVSGASAGAIVAGLYAAGLESERILGLLLRPGLWKSFVEFSALRRLLGLLRNRAGHTGLLSGHKLLRLFRQELGDLRIEGCKTARLAIAAANMSHNRQELLKTGDLAQAILASCAVPGMFAAQEFEGSLYWDGGIADPVPIEHWVEDESIGKVIVHLVLNESDLRAAKNSSPSLLRFRTGLSNTHRIISDEIFRLKCRLLRESGKEIFIYKTITPLSGPHRLGLGPRNAMLGRKTARRHSKELRKLVSGAF